MTHLVPDLIMTPASPIPLTDAEWMGMEALKWAGPRDVLAKDDAGMTALMVFCSENSSMDHTLAHRLLEAGSDPNAEDNRGYPVLWHCQYPDMSTLVPLLVEWGANPNTRVGEREITLLHEQVSFGKDMTIPRVLLKAGGDPFQKDAQGNIPLDLAHKENGINLLDGVMVELAREDLDRKINPAQPSAGGNAKVRL
jgi:ankyrin repeat protein